MNNERLPGDHTSYYLLDGLGSIVGMTDSSSNKVNSYDYDPFGVMLNQQEGVSNPFKFAGGYLDTSGFEQFGVRYYSPSLGRWTQQDPLAGSLGDLIAMCTPTTIRSIRLILVENKNRKLGMVIPGITIGFVIVLITLTRFIILLQHP